MRSITGELERIQEKLRVSQPVLTKVWVIDRPDLYNQLLAEIEKVATPANPPLLYRGDILIIEWRRWTDYNEKTHLIDCPSRDGGSMFTEEYRENFEKVWPYICAFPGVWLEMSNGVYHRLETRREVVKE